MNYKYSEDMKYLALYWALRFVETKEDIMVKTYNNNYQIIIDAEQQYVDFGNDIKIIGDKFLLLTNHKSFVILECVDKLLTMGYMPSEIIIDLQGEFEISVSNLNIQCFEWNKMDNRTFISKQNAQIYIKCSEGY